MTTCPYCLVALPRAQPRFAGRPIGAGDLLLCPECVEWSIFDEWRDLRKPTPEEMAYIVADPRCAEARKGMFN